MIHLNPFRHDPPEDEPIPDGRVNVSEQRLHDVLVIERGAAKREHLKTRAWVALMTAPAWGEVTAQFMGHIPAASTAVGMTVGSVVALIHFH